MPWKPGLHEVFVNRYILPSISTKPTVSHVLGDQRFDVRITRPIMLSLSIHLLTLIHQTNYEGFRLLSVPRKMGRCVRLEVEHKLPVGWKGDGAVRKGVGGSDHWCSQNDAEYDPRGGNAPTFATWRQLHRYYRFSLLYNWQKSWPTPFDCIRWFHGTAAASSSVLLDGQYRAVPDSARVHQHR